MMKETMMDEDYAFEIQRQRRLDAESFQLPPHIRLIGGGERGRHGRQAVTEYGGGKRIPSAPSFVPPARFARAQPRAWRDIPFAEEGRGYPELKELLLPFAVAIASVLTYALLGMFTILH